MIEKESANLLKNMENNHMKAVKELEDLYEKVKFYLIFLLETCVWEWKIYGIGINTTWSKNEIRQKVKGDWE